MKNRSRLLWLCLLITTSVTLGSVALGPVRAEEQATFTIRSFVVDGNTLLAKKTVQEALHQYTGPDKTADDVEKARAALEKVYHDAGYPAVLVNIPEQTTEKGLIHLQVIESTIGSVKVTGNRWFTEGRASSGICLPLRRAKSCTSPMYRGIWPRSTATRT